MPRSTLGAPQEDAWPQSMSKGVCVDRMSFLQLKPEWQIREWLSEQRYVRWETCTGSVCIDLLVIRKLTISLEDLQEEKTIGFNTT